MKPTVKSTHVKGLSDAFPIHNGLKRCFIATAFQIHFRGYH